MRSLVLSLAIVLMAIPTAALHAQAVASQPEQQHYIVVLKPGKGADPNVSALGGTVERSQYGRMFVTLPGTAADALRRHQRVKYIQRTLLPGEIVPSPKSLTAAAASLAVPHPQSFLPRANGNGSWSTGLYQYDGAGNVTDIGTAAAPNSDGKTNTYVYDVFGRLKSGTANFAGGNVSQAYTYDRYGNITQVDTTDPTGTYTNPIIVSPATNRLNGNQVTYDAAGNLTTDGTNSAHFDSLGMMTWKSASGTQDFYLYNAEDERIGVQSGNAFWTWSFRDESGHVLRQYQSIAGWSLSDWLWLEDYAYRGSRTLAAERVPEEGGRRDFHLDSLGTPRLITGTNGGLIARHDYLPFGLEITSIRQELDGGYDRIDPPHFTGHERDFTILQSYSSDSTDYMHARHYDTQQLRFFTPDSLLGRPEDPQSWNRYAYVLGNPVTLTDPTGLVENGSPCNTGNVIPCFSAWITHEEPGLTPANKTWLERYVRELIERRAQNLLQTIEKLGMRYLREADYIVLSVNVAIPNPVTATLLGPTGQVIVDRYGRVYLAAGGGFGKSATVVSGGVTGGWLDQEAKPDPGLLYKFCSGFSANGSLAFWGSAGETWGGPGAGFGTEVGALTPQAGGSATWSWKISDKGPQW